MSSTLQIEGMTVQEKLQAMEALWESLRQNEADIPVPQWHKDILDARERDVKEGRAKFLDWETAKQEIADEIRQNRVS
jgi:putative addiction module component (TIGR02574 family)